MPSPCIGSLSILSLIAVLPLSAQTYIDLNFIQNVQATDGLYPNMSTLGPEYYSGGTFDFRNVATVNGQSVDARVQITNTQGGYEFVGWLPNYEKQTGGPDGDLGVYYRFNGDFGQPTGGVSYVMSFYQGGGTFSQTMAIPDFRLLIYDHDGESMQSESIRTYFSDGLVGYQLHQNSGIHTHLESDAVRFDARGEGHSETSADGGFIVYYKNTSSIRFDLFATTTSGPSANYGIFSAYDGDLSLVGGSTTAFSPYTVVPEPSVSLITLLSASTALLRRRRSA